MKDKYNLNQPPHRLLWDVKRRIEDQLQRNGVSVEFDDLPAVEDLIDQYNTLLTQAWDENNRLEKRLRELGVGHFDPEN